MDMLVILKTFYYTESQITCLPISNISSKKSSKYAIKKVIEVDPVVEVDLVVEVDPVVEVDLVVEVDPGKV